MLPPTIVDIDVVSFASERQVKLESKVFCKVLHLAVLHGWRSERLVTQLPSAAWDTDMIVPWIEPYLSGSVSETDAKDLAGSLSRMLVSESLGLSPQVLFAALAVLAVAGNGSFGLICETSATDPERSLGAEVHGLGPGATATG